MEAASASEARRFGKYTLVAKLATGGMAEIFLARLHGDGGFEKLVCIKRILPHLARDPQFVAMFLDEARVAARISHPNVCQVFELGEWHGQYYIAMEYLEGVPLSVFRRKDYYPAPPDPRLIAGFGVQACEGLHHAHMLKRADGDLLGVVHRDISPQNLFATTDGIVKVLDFGIAKVQDASARTSTGTVKGTYAYMAPEQLRNEALDHRVDVWAVGVVLWETLAQQQLFKRETEFLTFEAITKLPIPDICSVRADVPPLFNDVLSRALSRRPDDRFFSARALGEALAQSVAPLGGAATTAMISEEVSHSFEATLAEQRMLLRIAREGGQFDLDKSSPLVAHGTHISTTPVSNIQRRVEEARAEVANFVAAKEAIDSLDADTSGVNEQRTYRFPSEGAFTPAPSRRSEPSPIERRTSQQYPAQGTSQPYPAQRMSQAYGAQRISQPSASDAWRRFDDTEPPMPFGRPSSQLPVAPAPRSRLPLIIVLVVLGATLVALFVLYIELRETKPAPSPQAASVPIVMTSEPTVPAPSPPAEPKITAPVEVPKVEKTFAAKPPPTKPEPKPVEVPNKVEPKKEVPRVAKEPKVDKTIEAKVEKKIEPKVEKKIEPKIEKKVEVKPEKEPEKVSGPPGIITIDSAPFYAVIYIDGKKYGETPLPNLKLSPGKHAVRAVSPSGSTRSLTINVEPGKTAVKRIEW